MLMHGRRESDLSLVTEVAESFRTGNLARECASAEAAYNTRI